MEVIKMTAGEKIILVTDRILSQSQRDRVLADISTAVGFRNVTILEGFTQALIVGKE